MNAQSNHEDSSSFRVSVRLVYSELGKSNPTCQLVVGKSIGSRSGLRSTPTMHGEQKQGIDLVLKAGTVGAVCTYYISPSSFFSRHLSGHVEGDPSVFLLVDHSKGVSTAHHHV